MAEKKAEQVALLDLDGSLADFDARMKEKLLELQSPGEPTGSSDWISARRDLIKRQPGFWMSLAPIPFGISLYHLLGELGYTRMILTKGPRTNTGAWAEKVAWCLEHVPEADITITQDKGLVYGKVLYDDWVPYITRWLEWRPRGKVLMLDAAHNSEFEHPNVLRCYRDPLETQRSEILEFLR